jgi:hypothetical protein
MDADKLDTLIFQLEQRRKTVLDKMDTSEYHIDTRAKEDAALLSGELQDIDIRLRSLQEQKKKTLLLG